MEHVRHSACALPPLHRYHGFSYGITEIICFGGVTSGRHVKNMYKIYGGSCTVMHVGRTVDGLDFVSYEHITEQKGRTT